MSGDVANSRVEASIRKLKRRVEELDALNVGSLDPESYRDVIGDLQRRIAATMEDVFNVGSADYVRFVPGSLDPTPIRMGGNQVAFSERLRNIRRGVEAAKSRLQSAILLLEERLSDVAQDRGLGILAAYDGLQLDPDIERAASSRYRSGHYADAVEAAVKALNNLVRLRAGLEKDGVNLMEETFSPKNPILMFNDLKNQSDVDEQKGFMQLFSGAVSGLRNPRAHQLINDDPERALEFIAFTSLLAKLLKEAKEAK